MSTKHTDTFESIVQSISENVKKPIELGYDNGVNVTSFFTDKVNSYSNHDVLLKELENNNFFVDKKKDANGYRIRAVYHFYTKGIIKRIDSSVLIEIVISNENTIQLIKSVYFTDMNI